MGVKGEEPLPRGLGTERFHPTGDRCTHQLGGGGGPGTEHQNVEVWPALARGADGFAGGRSAQGQGMGVQGGP